MANRQEKDQLLFQVMMDVQSYLIALSERDFQAMGRWESNLRQDVLKYRAMLESEAKQEDASNG